MAAWLWVAVLGRMDICIGMAEFFCCQPEIITTLVNLLWKWKVKVLVAQSNLTLSDPMDCSPPGSSVHGILQARILEWVAIPFSRGSSWLRDWTWVSCIAATRETQYSNMKNNNNNKKTKSYCLDSSLFLPPLLYYVWLVSYSFCIYHWNILLKGLSLFSQSLP